MKFKSAP